MLARLLLSFSMVLTAFAVGAAEVEKEIATTAAKVVMTIGKLELAIAKGKQKTKRRLS